MVGPAALREVFSALVNALSEEGVEVRGAVVLPARRRVATTTHLARSNAPPTQVAQFSLPLTNNAGVPFPPALLAAVIREVYEVAGGGTFHEAVGIWQDESRCYLDHLFSIEVWTSDAELLRPTLVRACRALDQESIAMTVSPRTFVWIVAGEP